MSKKSKENCKDNILEPNQVRNLFIWVHPEWETPWDNNLLEDEIKGYKIFIDRLKTRKSIALIRIPCDPKYGKESTLAKKFADKLEDLDIYASIELGDRYLLWEDGTRFVNTNNKAHTQIIITRFNLSLNNQQVCTANDASFKTEYKYLDKIFTFGKELYTCPLHQAYQECFNIASLARTVKYLPITNPVDIDFSKII